MRDMSINSDFYIWISSFPATFVEVVVFSPIYAFDHFVENQVAIAAWANFKILYPIQMVCLCVLGLDHAILL
jgi:uncharacterized protein (DUF983 family)